MRYNALVEPKKVYVETRMPDPLVDEVRARRQTLVRQHGGLKGWVRHLQDVERRAKRQGRVGARVAGK